jgi:hypothetical protein
MATNAKKRSNGKRNGRAATNGKRTQLPRWVYAYQLDPPQPEPRFKKINTLVRQAQSTAQRDGRLWTGRIVVETLITHLLIVTDHPGHVPAVNTAIEKELKHLNMGFALNGPARLPRLMRVARASRSSSKARDHSRPIEKSSGR